MPQTVELKAKAERLLEEAKCIKGILEGAKVDYESIIKPNIRLALVDQIGLQERNVMKEVEEQKATIDSWLDSFKEQVFIEPQRIEQPTNAWFNIIKANELTDDLNEMYNSTHYLSPATFLLRLARLKQQILDGALDGSLFEEPALLIYNAVTSSN